ncbi:MAG: hypothetical protein IT289_13335 [Oligoflexia bacterium]|nr:hypothetical protein [Oligoflexia bacterium]
MRMIRGIFLAVLFLGLATGEGAHATVKKKEWTFLTFLNGFNNLDRFGYKDMNEMEAVGSTDRINVVVQWASLRSRDVRRILVQKDQDKVNVTSPVVENLGRIDMGDPKELLAFIKWGVKNYPAKRYFVNVWNHGSGWHDVKGGGGRAGFEVKAPQSTLDISFDDFTGSSIDTKELAQVMRESAKVMGQKVDIYGSDACLMAMAEIATEMMDSVQVFLGSQELEPGDGWPYDVLLNEWNKKTFFDRNKSPQEVAKILTDAYVDSYTLGGVHCCDEVTFSAFDLNKAPALIVAMRALSDSILALPDSHKSAAKSALLATESYYMDDYRDLADFALTFRKSAPDAKIVGLPNLKDALKEFVIINKTTGKYVRSSGVAVWMPARRYQYSQYSNLYSQLAFSKLTNWNLALEQILNAH